MLIKEKTDVLCITETWLRENVKTSFIQIEGYNCIRKDRPLGRGGGVCIYVKEQYTIKPIQSIEPLGTIENLWLRIQVNKFKSFLVGVMYRPPNATAESFINIENMLSHIISLKENFYVLGDLNDDQLKSNKIADIVHSLGVHQLITEATRVTRNSSTLIDLIITNNKSSVVDIAVAPSIADHHEIKCTINLKAKKQKIFILKCRKKSNYSADNFQYELLKSTHDFNEIYNTDNVNMQVKLFNEIFLRSLDSIAPLVNIVMKRPPNKWMNDEIRKEIAYKNELLLAIKNSNPPSTELLDQFRKQRQKLRKMTTIAKARSYKSELKNLKKKPKKMWTLLNKIVQHRANKSQTNFENLQEKVDELNQHFATVGENVCKEVMQISSKSEELTSDYSCHTQAGAKQWRPEPVTDYVIMQTIYQLRNTNSMGVDNISLPYIKDSLYVTLPYIRTIINTSIVTNVFPSQWKHAIITPIYKKGDVNDPSNYRPISILTALSKILEKIVANQLLRFLESRQLLNKHQYAYRRNTSTEDALVNVLEAAYKSVDDGKISLLTLLDLSKAFDSVHHETLLKKLHMAGIRRDWFLSYLSYRTQCVKSENVVSESLNINYGVPQGSILGPILFLIFVNDIGRNLDRNVHITMYADDLQILISNTPAEIMKLKELTENSLISIKNWYDNNGLKVNADKTQCILIGTAQNTNKMPDNFYISFDNKKIEIENKVKSLGIWFDSNLTFKNHVNNLCSKLNGTLMYLNKIKPFLDNQSRLLVIHALIFSNINYCSIIWGKCSAKQRNQVQRSINYAAKVASNGKYKKSDHVSPLIKNLEWLNIDNIISLNEAACIYRSVHKYSSARTLNLTTRSELTSHSARPSRNGSSLHTEFRNTTIGTKAISINGTKNWNKIPREIRGASTLKRFKKLHKAFLLNQQSDQSNEIS